MSSAAGVFLHASRTPLDPGTLLAPRAERLVLGEVEAAFAGAEPPGHPGRVASVYMAWDIGTIEAMGLADDAFVHFVRPVGASSRHDARWVERACDAFSASRGLVDDDTARTIARCAQAYWAGTPSDEPLWETLAPGAEVVGSF